MFRVMLIAGCLLLSGDVNPGARGPVNLDLPVGAAEQPRDRQQGTLLHVIVEKY